MIANRQQPASLRASESIRRYLSHQAHRDLGSPWLSEPSKTSPEPHTPTYSANHQRGPNGAHRAAQTASHPAHVPRGAPVTAAIPEPPANSILLTVAEAARVLRIGRTLMYSLVMSGQVESVPIGRLRRIPAECLTEYVARLRASQHADAEAA
jgi:excisionase family DNA binding protein